MSPIKKLLIDMDGVLYCGNNPFCGARESLEYLKENSYDYILVTNTTRMSSKTLIKKLTNFGISIDENRVLTALSATVDYINLQKKNAKCYLIGPPESENEFKNSEIVITRNEEPVDYVVVGYDTNINFEKLNTAFRLIQDGAELIAMHEDKILPGTPKNDLALGPFVKCLEFPTDKKAIIVGKPSKTFFELAMERISGTKNDTAMIGDSLMSDIIGAKKAGLKTIMVKTGNYSEKELLDSSIKPDYLINSIKDLPNLLHTSLVGNNIISISSSHFL